MFKKLTEFFASLFKRKGNPAPTEIRQGFSVAEIIGSPYASIWDLIPGKPLNSSIVIVVVQGLTKVSDAINGVPLICGVVNNLNDIEKALLTNLHTTSGAEPCSCLYLLYEATLSVNPSSQAWAVAYNNGTYKVFTRRTGENQLVEFVAV
jgi:hypothetical protein